MSIRSALQRLAGGATRIVAGQPHAIDDNGSAIFETALSSIIFLTFIFAVMEGAFGIYSYHFIAEAAREGTRYAIVRGSSAGTACASYSSYDCLASTANIQNFVLNLGYPGINPANMTVSVSNAGYPAGVTCSPSTSCDNPGNLVTVKVQYSVRLLIPFIPSHTYSMSSSAAMIIQN